MLAGTQAYVWATSEINNLNIRIIGQEVDAIKKYTRLGLEVFNNTRNSLVSLADKVDRLETNMIKLNETLESFPLVIELSREAENYFRDHHTNLVDIDNGFRKKVMPPSFNTLLHRKIADDGIYKWSTFDSCNVRETTVGLELFVRFTIPDRDDNIMVYIERTRFVFRTSPTIRTVAGKNMWGLDM